MHTWRTRARTHTRTQNTRTLRSLRDYELRGVRAYEGSSNEKPHYFLMHLLIDQSRKGSAPPTLRPPLPSVNHSRNNLMIGALVLLSRLPRRFPSTIRVGGLLWRRTREIFFHFSRPASPRFPLYIPRVRLCLDDEKDDGHLRPIYTEQKWERRARLSRREYSRVLAYLAIERVRLLLDTRNDLRAHDRKRSSFMIARPDEREKNRTSYPCIISFECRVATTCTAPSQCTAGEYFRRNSRVNRERTRIFTFSIDKKSLESRLENGRRM